MWTSTSSATSRILRRSCPLADRMDWPYRDSPFSTCFSPRHAVSVGPEVHESLDPPRTIRTPTLPAYTLGKILSARSRATSRRRTKDLVYLYQILTQQSLRETLLAMLPGHLRDYPETAYSASKALSGFVNQTTVRRDVAAQLLELDMVPEGQDPLADFTAHLRRFQHEIDQILAEP